MRISSQVSRGYFSNNIGSRNRGGKTWNVILFLSTIVGFIALAALLVNILDSVFGYVLMDYKIDPVTLTVDGTPWDQQNKEQMIDLIKANLSSGAIKKLESEKALTEWSRSQLHDLIAQRILRSEYIETWSLFDSVFKKEEVMTEVTEIRKDQPDSELVFISWVTAGRIAGPQSSEAMTAGIRTAILGSLWTILVTVLFALPLGVAAAIYLEEYAGKSWINRLIQININNLAGVPSIIYGILGLVIFVRMLEPLTSGALFGFVDPTTANGRTVFSAGFTLGLLVLPLIIINAQEAIRAVPQSLRKASYGLGATKWQTIWSHVLPNALPGIMTGAILAVSRAIGETAPLIVVGASTAISFDPTSPFSKFTTLPIQIYQWTSRPQAEWRHLAAGGIIVLLVLLLSLNAAAILIRNRFSRKI